MRVKRENWNHKYVITARDDKGKLLSYSRKMYNIEQARTYFRSRGTFKAGQVVERQDYNYVQKITVTKTTGLYKAPKSSKAYIVGTVTIDGQQYHTQSTRIGGYRISSYDQAVKDVDTKMYEKISAVYLDETDINEGKIKDDRVFAFGLKKTILNTLRDIRREIKKEKEDFVNW